MSAAAQTSEPANPSTGKDCLIAVARWLVVLIFVHWLITRGHKLVATLGRGIPAADLARIHRGLDRAAALQAELLALRPTEGDLDDIERRRAIAAVVIEICTDLGIFRGRPVAAAKAVHRRVTHRLSRTPTTRRSQARPAIPSRATGPPNSPLRPTGRRGSSCEADRWRWGTYAGGTPASGAIGASMP